jgi:hypothetical protein
VTEGSAGQTTIRKLGLVSGWCSSMLTVSPLRVMGPLASTVGDDGDTAELAFRQGPVLESPFLGGPADVVGPQGPTVEFYAWPSCAYVARGSEAMSENCL